MHAMMLQVWVPSADATFGCAEFELLMGCIWENMEEICNFAPPPKPAIPIGSCLPPVAPQPEVLGVDRSTPPDWEVEVNVGVIGVAVGGVPPPSTPDPLEGGPALAKVVPAMFVAARCWVKRLERGMSCLVNAQVQEI